LMVVERSAGAASNGRGGEEGEGTSGKSSER